MTHFVIHEFVAVEFSLGNVVDNVAVIVVVVAVGIVAVAVV